MPNAEMPVEDDSIFVECPREEHIDSTRVIIPGSRHQFSWDDNNTLAL